MYKGLTINGRKTIGVLELYPMSELKPFQRALVYHKDTRDFSPYIQGPGTYKRLLTEEALGWIPMPTYRAPNGHKETNTPKPRFTLGRKSLQELQGVNPVLVRIVKRAIEITTQDFTVHDGLRTQAEQERMVAAGASHTMNSKHLTGNAVDLVPYVNGKLRWEWPLIYPIASAMRKAALEQGVNLRWGGDWQDLTKSGTTPAIRHAYYTGDFSDGAHYELYTNDSDYLPATTRTSRRKGGIVPEALKKFNEAQS